MPKYALFTTILLLTTCAVSMAEEDKGSFICLSSLCQSDEQEATIADDSIFQTDFRGLNAYGYPPEE